jgi:tRNA(Ile)-lysidine synthase
MLAKEVDRPIQTNSSNLENQIQSLITRRNLIPPGALVLAAVSGGPDSTAMLHSLHRLGYPLHAAHLNHGLRAEAVDDALFVEAFCTTIGIPVTIGNTDVQARRDAGGGGVQEVARELRYEFFDRTADEVGADIIATAHTRDDRVETVLLNIIRGAGGDGLRGIPYRRGRIVRPLLDTSRAEVEEYLVEHDITARHDASNDTVKYARNRVRNELIPYLERHFSPNLREAILRLSQIAGDEGDYLDQQAEALLSDASTVDAANLTAMPAALQRRALRLWLERVGSLRDVDMAHVEFIRSRLADPFAHTLPGGVRIVGDGQWIERQAHEEPIPSAASLQLLPLPVPSEAEFQGWFVCVTGDLPAGMQPVVRTLAPGDRMRFSYGSKKLSDIFREAKKLLPERWSVPLLVDAVSGEVIAIANGKVSDYVPGLIFTARRKSA